MQYLIRAELQDGTSRYIKTEAPHVIVAHLQHLRDFRIDKIQATPLTKPVPFSRKAEVVQ